VLQSSARPAKFPEYFCKQKMNLEIICKISDSLNPQRIFEKSANLHVENPDF
jgi:hypothetical protein